MQNTENAMKNRSTSQHLSGALHLTGKSRFIADEAPLQGTLYAKFLFSPVAHAGFAAGHQQAESYPGI
jgi:xanthine dehydrogenase molybdopterin-binding subunit B